MADRNLASGRKRIVALRELIEAIDRRVAHVERLGEVRIAREAAALRLQALARIEQLATAQGRDDQREAEGADAVMADDGWPLNAT
jgi:hypothetical protein